MNGDKVYLVRDDKFEVSCWKCRSDSKWTAITVDGARNRVVDWFDSEVEADKHVERIVRESGLRNAMVLAPGVRVLHTEDMEGKSRLEKAVWNLYLSGRWECVSLRPETKRKLWEELRDAAGIPPGTATKYGV